MIKVLIKEIGEVKYYLVSDGELHHVSGRIEVPINKWIESEGEEPIIIPTPKELPYMLVDNQTQIPVVNAQGQPVTITKQVPSGNYVMIPVGNPIRTDPETNDPIYDMVPDYNQPVMQNVDVQKTIGEYEMIYKLFFQQIPSSTIEQMIHSAIERRMGLCTTPYVFIEA